MMNNISIKMCDGVINELEKSRDILNSVGLVNEVSDMKKFKNAVSSKLNIYRSKKRMLVNGYLLRVVNDVIGINEIDKVIVKILKKDSKFICENGMICKTGIKELDNIISAEELENARTLLT